VKSNDNIKDLFSKSFEQHSLPVREELWKGVQSKMAVAGVTSVAATKTVSFIAKWLIGSAVVASGIVVAVFVGNNEPVSNKVAPKKTIATTKNKSEQATTDISVKHSEVQNNLEIDFDYGLFMDTVFFKPFCLVKGPVLTDDIPPVLVAATDVVAENSTTPIAAAETTIKETQTAAVFPENTDKPVSAVLASELTKFPNFFSPNGDGNNDVYYVEIANKDQIQSFLIQIYNVENKLVFQSTDPSFNWNGEYNNEVKEGIYFCLVTIVDGSGKVIKDKQLIEAKK
jgi:gliding motility-associated-like protein